jgi:hypothetical protein
MDVRRAVGGAAAAALLATGLVGTGAHAASSCPTGWGSLPESGRTSAAGSLTDVRAGRHACFDRLVLDVAAPATAAYDVRYVPVVRTEGAGARVPLRGAADLRVIVRAPSYDPDTGALVYRPADRREIVRTRGFRTFRQVAWAGSFEGQTTVGLGVRARLPFRVMVLPGPGAGSRVVVDVAHSW